MGSSLMEMHKTAQSKSGVVKINITFVVFMLVTSVDLLILYSLGLFDNKVASLAWCTLSDCNAMKDGMELKLAYDNYLHAKERAPEKVIIEKDQRKHGCFFESLRTGEKRIGVVNMGKNESAELRSINDGKLTVVEFERVPDNLKWTDLFPSDINEDNELQSACPEIPMPVFSAYEEMDVVVAKVPCQSPKPGWYRDVFRLQVHLAAANLVVKKARKDGWGAAKVALLSECEPMRELFRCDDLVAREGQWWIYKVQVERLAEKVSLPWGSCRPILLHLPTEGINSTADQSNVSSPAVFLARRHEQRREAYATIIHSSEEYVCGALMLAHSLRNTGSTGDRDLVLLHDDSITRSKLQTLAAAGWTLRKIDRIHNPRAKRGAYNEYNFSKFRLWRLTEYDKIVFVDTDILVLRSLDHLFRLPQMSAARDDSFFFNSGVMVVEPSNCTFDALMAHRDDIVSYNGGDQGFLNEMFAWWHRLPKRLNYFKLAWRNTTEEKDRLDRIFATEPPELHAIHYFGVKPWRCYRDYDCNWDVGHLRMYASDEAHRTWWQRYDEIEEKLRWLCGLTAERIDTLEMERQKAERMGYSDGHWKINITDQRRFVTAE